MVCALGPRFQGHVSARLTGRVGNQVKFPSEIPRRCQCRRRIVHTVTVTGGTRRNHAPCTEQNFPAPRLNWTLGEVLAPRLYSSAGCKSTRSTIEPNEARGRVKRIERKAIEFLYKFLRPVGRIAAQDMAGGSSIAETRCTDGGLL